MRDTQFLAALVTAILLMEASVSAVNYKVPANCGANKRNNRVYSKTEVKSQTECESLCSQSDTCLSLNYENKTTRTCQLLSKKTNKVAHNLMPKKGWSYYERTGRLKSDTCSDFGFGTCKARISHIGEMERMIVRSSTWGYWGKDTFRKDDDRVYHIYDDSENRLYMYASEDACVKNDHVIRTMPFTCHGFQAIVHDNVFYCRRGNDRYVVAYDIDNDKQLGLISFNAADIHGGYNAGYSDQCSFDFNQYSDITMMADQSGLYALWGQQPLSCRLALSRINTTTLEVEQTWFAPLDRRTPGNAFMVCGRVYLTDHYNSNPSQIRWIWDVRTGNLTSYFATNEYSAPGYLFVPNYNTYMGSVHFNPADGKLYMKSNTWWNRYHIIYDDRSPSDDYRGVV